MRYRFTEYEAAGEAQRGEGWVGGQPEWVGPVPQWPVKWGDGELAEFVGQFRVAADAGGGGVDRAVYLFAVECSGEHIAVVQPGGQVSEECELRAAVGGPTVLEQAHRLKVVDVVEFADVERELEPVEGEDDDDRAWRLEEELEERQKDERDSRRMNQLGGPGVVPVWLQGDDLPGEDWQLVAQFDSCQLPFAVNFGDTGVGYLFLSPEGERAEFFFQSC
ncbi:hypothetical protein ACIBI4_32150 [Streptomyces sp. NPDC050418]|uniref:hypothetical protein n=1 Tax=Streptomyces sp. NPDC050418 TaxID=3365612 RepID=UPI0037AAB5E2